MLAKTKSCVLFLLLMSLGGCGPQFPKSSGSTSTENWQLLWSTEAEFKSPESAAIAADQGLIFISNVNGYERNGRGFISTLRMDGSIKELKWLEGINAPTGLAITDDILWAVDIDQLLKISISEKRVISRLSTTDKNLELNDVAVSTEGDVFVTGSNSNTIYVVEDDRLKPWLQDQENLKFANGIYVDDTQILVAAYHLIQIDRNTKKTKIIADQKLINDLEGVKADGFGGFFVSMIGNRPVHQLSANFQATPIFSGKEYVADFDIYEGVIVAPTGKNEISAFGSRR